jgi:hypothetical protein
MADVTAKVKVDYRDDLGNGQVNLRFSPEYDDDRNKTWAEFTPSLSLSMNVKESVAGHFPVGASFTLTFTKESEADDAR